jgi:two-component system chemotaxis sensor kinase CheA
MDELLGEFLAETSEHLEGVETQLLQFERNPHDASLVAGIFRLVHTIKGTASFLGLDRLQTVAHAAENLLGDLRDGAPPTSGGVSAILAAIDRIKEVLKGIEAQGSEPAGDDSELIERLHAQSASNTHGGGHGEQPAIAPAAEPKPKAKRSGGSKKKASPAPGATADETVSQTDESSEDGEDDASPHPGQPPAKPAAAGGEVKKPAGGGQAPGKSSETIRVAVDTIERIMQLVSELVLNRNQLLEITRNRENDPIKPPLQRLSGLTTDLQDAVMRARMQPVGRLFSSLPRLMRELSAELKKKINLVTEGAETELDRQLIEVLRDPLTHIIRNCADHGIELPEDRRAAGKSEYGEVRVSAAHEAGQITIDISDDGRGLNIDRIKEKVISQRLATHEQVERMTTEEICRFIFAPGFSTAAKVTSVSGRGVGMDVVRSNIESIGGSVTLSTVPGHGSRFSLKIPLTLAIAPALIVRVGNQRFALPQTAVVEAVGLGSESRHVIEKVQDGLVLRLRDEVIPVIDLAAILKFGGESGAEGEKNKEEELVVILRIGSDTFGVRVDGVVDVQEIVVKPLNASLAHLKIFTGQTILGDGSVVLILDPGGIGTQLGIEKSGEKKLENVKESHAATDRTRLVLFRAGDGLPKVLPLSLLSRIEMVDAKRIERSDGRYVMLHQGKLMPLLPTSPMQDIGHKPHPVLVITANGHTIGLLVDEIIDIVEEDLSVELPSLTDDMVGATEIRGEAVELIDVTYYLQAAYSSLYRQDNRNVLLVEDDLLFSDMLKPVLSSAGYRVTTATSAEEVAAIMERRRDFDAFLVDAEIEATPGRKLAAHLRDVLGDESFPIFQLYERPAHDMLNVAVLHPNTVNLSKLDRQGILGSIASVLAQRDAQKLSRGMAA